jgi:hypothetical protein
VPSLEKTDLGTAMVEVAETQALPCATSAQDSLIDRRQPGVISSTRWREAATTNQREGLRRRAPWSGGEASLRRRGAVARAPHGGTAPAAPNARRSCPAGSRSLPCCCTAGCRSSSRSSWSPLKQAGTLIQGMRSLRRRRLGLHPAQVQNVRYSTARSACAPPSSSSSPRRAPWCRAPPSRPGTGGAGSPRAGRRGHGRRYRSTPARLLPPADPSVTAPTPPGAVGESPCRISLEVDPCRVLSWPPWAVCC